MNICRSKNKLLRNDYLLVISIVIVFLILGLIIYHPNSSDTAYIQISYKDNNILSLPLDSDYSGYIEDTGVKITINNNKAFIEHSDCPDKLCQKMPAITADSYNGTSIVCLPNYISITKTGRISEEVDVVAG